MQYRILSLDLVALLLAYSGSHCSITRWYHHVTGLQSNPEVLRL